VAGILKKITSIEPDESDILDAIKAKPKKQKDTLITSISEVGIDDDPVPAFITREVPQDILSDQKETEIPEETKTEEIKLSSKDVEIPASSPAEPITSIAETSMHSIDAAPSTQWMKWAGIMAVLLWLAAAFSYLYGFFDLGQKWTDLTPIQITGLLMAIILPAILLGILFYTFQQLSKISEQSHNLARTANKLMQPDESVISKTSLMSEAIKTEINSVDARIDQALARMSTLETVLKEQTQNLETASGMSSQTADDIVSRLSTQRLALESIAGTFDNRIAMFSTSLEEHTTKLDGSTQLAEQKIQEARISVESAAERINAASDVVRGNSIDAASTLTHSHEEIENLANMIRERSAELDEVYRKHAKDLTNMISQLRDEQQNMSISLDEQLTKMRDTSLAAKVSAESLTNASQAGRKTVEALAEATQLTDTAVKQRFAEMENMVRYSTEKAENISGQAAQRVQDSLTQSRKEISRIEDDMLALQNRLSVSKTAEKLDLNEPAQPKPKRRGRLNLRAVTDSEIESNIEIPSLRPIITIPAVKQSEEIELDFDTDRPSRELLLQNPLDGLDVPATQDAPKDVVQSIESHGNNSKNKKERSGWRWRDMLGGLDRPDTTTAMDSLTPAPKQRDISDQRMVASLTALGLSPAAVIDDGCIIEAANIRRSKGSIAMSQTVSHRMGDLVRHLHRSMEENAALKSDARAYVAQFNARMVAIEDNREAIRTRFESDAGRAYLLCDAALNG